VTFTKHWRTLRLRHRESRRESEQALTRLGVKTPSVTAPLAKLSGGNQQKVIMGRWLQATPSLLLLDEPTQGVDVAARQGIHSLIHEAVSTGAGALVVASDFEELAELADRVLVVSAGRIVAEVPGSELTALRLTQVTR
jgi:ribose transport system ATP-binding protein